MTEKAEASQAAPRKTGKNIVLCSDGTGNRGGKGRGTNVWEIFNAVWRQPNAEGDLPNRTQITFYDDGVGTQSFIVFKILGGAIGLGYSRNIRQLYQALVSEYDDGDSIYLFGFSRGAYTVRGLAGLILTQGILDRRAFKTSEELEDAVRDVFRANRERYNSLLTRLRRWLRRGRTETGHGTGKSEVLPHLRDKMCPETKLQFIGVWDTVDAVGLPVDEFTDVLDRFARFRFPDHRLNSRVVKACHAISIDDERHTFWPVMWDEGSDPEPERIEQVWFPGVHSNVGGGYPKDQMAKVALDWMMKKAEDQGLQFYKNDRDRVREAANAHGKLYDSRAGLAAYYRYEPRDMMRISHDSKAGVEVYTPKIHVSALRRAARATDGYAPANIPKNVSIVGTYANDEALVKRLGSAFAATAEGRDNRLNEVRRNVSRRRALYFLFLSYSLAILLAAGWFYWCAPPSVELADVEAPGWIGWVFDLIGVILPEYLFGFFLPLLVQAKIHWLLSVIVILVLVALVTFKFVLERKSRWLGLDAWREFREAAYPVPRKHAGRTERE